MPHCLFILAMVKPPAFPNVYESLMLLVHKEAHRQWRLQVQWHLLTLQYCQFVDRCACCEIKPDKLWVHEAWNTVVWKQLSAHRSLVVSCAFLECNGRSLDPDPVVASPLVYVPAQPLDPEDPVLPPCPCCGRRFGSLAEVVVHDCHTVGIGI